MSQESYSTRDVDRLIQQLRDDDLGPGDEAKLQDIIRNHPIARRRFVRQLAVDAQLKEALEMTSVVLPSEGERAWLKGWPVIAAVLTIIGVLGAFVLSHRSTGEAEASSSTVISSEMNYGYEGGIAVVSREVGAVWAPEKIDSVMSIEGRAILSPGILTVKSGVLQVDFYSGATVLIQGPAKFELVSPDLGRLYLGRVTAEVPPPAAGFRIESSNYEVVDLGTSFGMWVKDDGTREVHVFDGEVTIQDEFDSGVFLKKNEAIKLTSNRSEPRRIRARPDYFPLGETLNQVLKSKQSAWKKQRDRLKEDPDVVMYYTFEKGLDWVRKIPNEAEKFKGQSDGAVVGCRAVEGRWPGKKALGFENSSNRVRLDVPGEFKSLTLAAWVKIDKFHSSRISLLNPQADQDRFLHWNLTGSIIPDANGFTRWSLHFSDTIAALGIPEGREHYHCETNINRLLQDRKWAHLALVYDSDKEEVRHFANGVKLHTNKILNRRPLNIGISDIGNWPYKEWAEGTEFEVRYLHGAMDEFVIAKRAFADREILAIYDAGKP